MVLERQFGRLAAVLGDIHEHPGMQIDQSDFRDAPRSLNAFAQVPRAVSAGETRAGSIAPTSDSQMLASTVDSAGELSRARLEITVFDPALCE